MSRAIILTGGICAVFILVGASIAAAGFDNDPPSELYVRTVPPGAKVLVDGKQVGKSDNLFKVEPGARKIEVELEGFEPIRKEVNIAAARIKRVVFELEKSPSESQPQENLLTNPGAEEGDKKPKAWQQGAAIPEVTYSWDKNNACEGKASLCIEKKANRYFPIASWTQVVERKGDAPTLELSAHVKAQKMTKAILDVLFLDKNDNWISHKWVAYIGSKQQGEPPADHDWKQYSGKVDIPSETAKIVVGLQVYGPGIVWFDDVRLREVSEQHEFSLSSKSAKPIGKFPRTIKTAPEIGVTDVDPELKEISVTFDRDMQVGNHSWCGSGPHFPKITGEPKWIDRRTCVLPVALKKARAYRLAINWDQFNNFRSAEGVPAVPTPVYFCTRGASPKLIAQMTPPKIVAMSIEDGAKDVPPGKTKLSVTFDQAMGEGMSWCNGPNTPKMEAVEGSSWSADKKTCSIYALLEPDQNYTIYINSEHFKNFMNVVGVPINPTPWTFTTGATQ